MALNEVDPAANRSTANGVTTVFPYTFEIASKNEIEVLADTTTKTVDIDYTVDGIGNSGGGNVTFLTAPANGTVVTRLRKVPATQTSTYTANEGFPHSRVENDYDKIWMAIQQIREQLHRSLLLPKSSALVDQGMDVPTVGSFARGKVGGGIDWATVVPAGSIAVPVAVNQGGTGGTTAAGARTNLDVPSNAEAILDTIIDAKGDLIVGTGNDTPVRFPVGSNGKVLQADSSQSAGVLWADFIQPRNPVINGNIEVWQRGTAFAAAANNSFSADRWGWSTVGAGVVTINRSTNVPSVGTAGVLFNYSLEVDVTTADAAIAAGDLYAIYQKIEGFNWRHFAQRGLTVSFWVMSSKTGLHSVSLQNTGADRTYVVEYTVNAADTWEYKTATFTASPSAGTWDYTTGVGAVLRFTLMAGSTFTTSSLNTWNVGAAHTSTNQVNVMDSTSNFFRLTGVKMELGSIATPIQFVPFEEELLRCMRYYQKSFLYITAPAANAGTAGALTVVSPFTGTSTIGVMVPTKVPMRTTITTVTGYNPSAAGSQWRNTTDAADDSGSSVVALTLGDSSFALTFTPNAANTVGDVHAIHWTVDTEL